MTKANEIIGFDPDALKSMKQTLFVTSEFLDAVQPVVRGWHERTIAKLTPQQQANFNEIPITGPNGFTADELAEIAAEVLSFCVQSSLLFPKGSENIAGIIAEIDVELLAQENPSIPIQ